MPIPTPIEFVEQLRTSAITTFEEASADDDGFMPMMHIVADNNTHFIIGLAIADVPVVQAVAEVITSVMAEHATAAAVVALVTDIYYQRSPTMPKGKLSKRWKDGDPDVGEALSILAVNADGETGQTIMPYTRDGTTIVWSPDPIGDQEGSAAGPMVAQIVYGIANSRLADQ